MKKTAILIVCFIALFTLSSCSLFSSKAPLKHYYQVYYQPQVGSEQPIKAILRIKTFNADKAYKKYNLVYRTSYEEMFYYNTHFWASRPDDMITDLVANHFAKQRVFSDIIITMDKKPDYVMSGRILALDEVIEDEKSYARVAIIFELKDYKTTEVVVAHSFDTKLETKGRKPVDVVRAMGEIINSETELFISKIYETIGH
ncbi:membrane integrity-associated transporter subunit PqiC [bacterium]|nr:membrane integrity-associated transporter subunit PqiC [bacterium]MBP5591516.1 membrane integrity-associated transporter subunit PqiC [bacterium]